MIVLLDQAGRWMFYGVCADWWSCDRRVIDGSGWTTNNATVAYDAAGRLVSSFPAAGVSYTYGYGSSLPGCWAGSGRNSDRTTRTGSGGPIVYCYNDRDQLVSYSVNGATSQQASYDQFGQTSSLASKSFGWSPRGTHISTTTSATTITFERDSTDRIIRRSQTGQSDVWYGYNTGTDQASYTATATTPYGGTANITDQISTLPGGVTLQRHVTDGAVRYSLPNIHGDLLAIVDQNGTKQTNTYHRDTNGNPIPPSMQPDLLTGNLEQGWLGQYTRQTDTTDPTQPIIEMGTRPYIPTLARFLSIDPTDGGNNNDYT